MSMSAPARVPLGPLPLSRFVPSLNSFPSPISLPSKRNAPVASSSQEGVKVRKMSRTDEDGHETIRRSRVKEVTPKAKAVLERDDLGVGKSPARRLFVDDCPAGTSYSLGISGAVATSSTSPAQSRRTLAPSPPIESSMKQCYTVEASSSTHPLLSIHPSDNIPLHDPGFIIFPDETADTSAPLGVGIGTPKSKRTVSNTINSPTNLAQDATAHIPSSASSSRTIEPTYHDDQENFPPTWSVTSTPSKDSARSTPSKSGASKYEAEEETYISSGGSGRRRLRKIERSKLGLESVLRGEENGDNEEDEEELTPGRREALARFMDKGKGKAKLAREIDRI